MDKKSALVHALSVFYINPRCVRMFCGVIEILVVEDYQKRVRLFLENLADEFLNHVSISEQNQRAL